MFGSQSIEGRLHETGDLAIALRHDVLVVGTLGSDVGPVDGRKELNGDRRRQGKWRGEDRVDPERRAKQDRKHLDAQAVQAEEVCHTLTAREDHDRVVSTVGDHGDDRDLSTQRKLHEPVVVRQVDTITFGPRSARLVIATGVDEDEGTLFQGGFGLLMSGWYGPEPPQDTFEARDGEEKVIGESVKGLVETASAQNGQTGDPDIGHVEQSGVVANQQHSSVSRNVLDPEYLRKEEAYVSFTSADHAANEFVVTAEPRNVQLVLDAMAEEFDERRKNSSA